MRNWENRLEMPCVDDKEQFLLIKMLDNGLNSSLKIVKSKEKLPSACYW